MTSELAPLRRALALSPDEGGRFDFAGNRGGVQIGAAVTGMGLAAAQSRTEAILAAGPVAHLLVVGVAGGVAPDRAVGTLLAPQVLRDERDGASYRPTQIAATATAGVLLGSDRLRYDADYIARLRREGVIGVDMESAAIAGACARHGCPFSVYRAVSDPVLPGPHFEEIFRLARADGSPDYPAAMRYLLRKPWRLPHLASMGLGSQRAVRTASRALLADLDLLLARLAP